MNTIHKFHFSQNKMMSYFMILAIVILSFSATFTFYQNVYAFPGTAYKVDTAFYTNGGINPHYGAFFNGQNGHSQFYTGGNQPSGYSSWDWWPSNRTVLLLEKSWLFGPPTANKWNGSNHHAELSCPC